MVNIFCADMRRVGELNEAWDEWLDEGQRPRARLRGRQHEPARLGGRADRHRRR